MGGVCVTHGAKVKQCSFKGCTKQARIGGVCITHGATVKGCSVKGCPNGAIKSGVCITHGAKKKQCSFKGCTNQARIGGVCITHGATKKRCIFEGFRNGVVKAGVCITHGAKLQHPPKVKNANDNNPEPPQNVVPTAVLSRQLSNFFDDEEELNSWIWRSSQMARNFGASKSC
jgi:hypothetical protein